MTKAVIFDINGVIIQSPLFSDIFHEKFGIPKEEFLPVLKDIMAKVRLPNAGNSFSYWKPYLEKWGLDLSEKEFFDFWFSSEKENVEIIGLVKILKKKGIKVFILSNNFIERTNYYNINFPFLKEIFDRIYYSWQTGFVKPDIRAYQNLLSENDLKPEECIYFDNSEENIKIASGLGIKSFIFKNAKNTEEILNSVI